MARLRGAHAYREIEEMTREAMEGLIPVEAVFGRRLKIIRPTRVETESIGALYIETVEPDVREVLAALRQDGRWEVVIVSGGYRQAIYPLAEYLEVERVEAVDLHFDEKGGYRGYDIDYPTTRSGGKPEVVRRLRREMDAGRIVMVGDGVSDLEAKPEVDLFVGFGGFVEREKVKQEADYFITRFRELPALL